MHIVAVKPWKQGSSTGFLCLSSSWKTWWIVGVRDRAELWGRGDRKEVCVTVEMDMMGHRGPEPGSAARSRHRAPTVEQLWTREQPSATVLNWLGFHWISKENVAVHIGDRAECVCVCVWCWTGVKYSGYLEVGELQLREEGTWCFLCAWMGRLSRSVRLNGN